MDRESADGTDDPESESEIPHCDRYRSHTVSERARRGSDSFEHIRLTDPHADPAAFLEDNFTPHVYEQEDGRVRNYSSNVEAVVDPTAKRERRLVDLVVDGDSVDPEARYSVATFTRPGDSERDLGNCGFPFRDVRVEDGVVPVDVIVDYLEGHSPLEYGKTELVRTPDDGGDVQNTPADGPYPYVQPGVDYAGGEEYFET